MANKRWDLKISHKDKGGKWRSQKVGVIFEGDKGELQIRIDPGISLATTEGVNLTGWIPEDKNVQQRGNGRQSQPSDNGDAGGEDHGEIPF